MKVSTRATLCGRFVVMAAVVWAVGLVSQGQAAIESRSILKSFFETGDKPTQPQFATLIDSVLSAELNYGDTAADHTIRLDHGSFAIDALGNVRSFGVGETVDDSGDFGSIGGDVTFNPLATGHPNYAGIQFEQGGELRYGFLQLAVNPPGSSTPYAIHLQHFVYDDVPGTPVTTFFQPVPEPGSAVLAMLALSAGLLWRRKCGP